MTPASAATSLVLGTVQLGLPYGVANRTGQPDQDVATEIVRVAWQGGIREFDTAQAYSASESVLGESLRRLGVAGKANVITKFDPDMDHLDRDAMLRSVEGSLKRLGVGQLTGVMLHREASLELWDRGLGRIAAELVSQGLVGCIGVSAYTPEGARAAMETDGVDIVQVPTSVLDRRFEKAGLFRLARQLGKRVYVRSVFLQGLVLIDPGQMPAGLADVARPVIERLESLAGQMGLSRRELALMVVRATIGDEDRVVFGAETPDQVRENLQSWLREPISGVAEAADEVIGPLDEGLLNPATWPKRILT